MWTCVCVCAIVKKNTTNFQHHHEAEKKRKKNFQKSNNTSKNLTQFSTYKNQPLLFCVACVCMPAFSPLRVFKYGKQMLELPFFVLCWRRALRTNEHDNITSCFTLLVDVVVVAVAHCTPTFYCHQCCCCMECECSLDVCACECLCLTTSAVNCDAGRKNSLVKFFVYERFFWWLSSVVCILCCGVLLALLLWCCCCCYCYFMYDLKSFIFFPQKYCCVLKI